MSGITSAAVALPPRKPYRSASTTRAPAWAAPSAAPRPAGPPPTTRTSASPATTAVRSGSTMVRRSPGRGSGGTGLTRGGSAAGGSPGPVSGDAVEQLHQELVVAPGLLLHVVDRAGDMLAQLFAVVPRAIDHGEQGSGAH